MKIFSALQSGINRVSVIWKGIIIIWFITFLLAVFVTGPAKGIIKSSVGESMIEERLATHLDLEVFQDPGMHLNTLMSVIFRGFLFLIPISILINSFFAGGLFSGLKGSSERFTTSSFWKYSAENFWSFLTVSLIMTLIFIVLCLIVIGIPVAIAATSGNISDASVARTVLFSAIIMIFIATIPLLVTDYARAWLVSTGERAPFRAIGVGFSQTFRNFGTSWALMLILLIIHLLYIWLTMRIITRMSASTQGGIILLFIVSQVLFFGRLLLKTFRFGSVISLMELNDFKAKTIQEINGDTPVI
jgi:hypothetical protein